ncbi:MAG: autotransporter-associated beta strand repeat-containing protein [Verrucomicrobiae bacterium]|nr:autotransporter-associated beta strand repeat-containing protein [Verrucomicrobiae bacterium]
MKSSSKVVGFAAAGAILWLATSSQAQVWTNASAATGWLDPLNWDSNVVPSSGTEAVQFGTAPTSGSVGVGINMSAAGGLVSIGSIEVTSARSSANVVIGNNSTSQAGVLQLNGATVNGVAGTILRNAGAGTTTLVITNGFGAGPFFPMGLSNTLAGGVVDATSPIVIYSIITGNGFTKLGAGTLTMTSSNRYSGNTTISNGVITLTDNAYLNNSTIVLAGGILERAAQNITPARANAYKSPVSVVKNSTLRTTTSSTRTIHFDALFSGAAGTTLLVTNATPSATPGTNHFRLYAGGINYAGNIILAASGLNKTILELYNTNNPAGGSDQVYSGIISGGGNVYKNIEGSTPGGNVIFSNANTYTGVTEVRSGFFGLGADNALGFGNVILGWDLNPLGLYAVGASRTLTNDVVADWASLTASTAKGSTNLQVNGSQNLTFAGRILIHTNTECFVISNTAVTTFSGVVTNAGPTAAGIVKQGPGRLVLSGTNTFGGTTTVASGTLAFSGNGSIINSTNFIIFGGTTLDVSTRNSTLTLSNSQTLRVTSQNSTPATLIGGGTAGLALGGTSPLFMEYAAGVPALTVSGGTLALGGGRITVTILGAPLVHGNYLLMDANSGGSVAGGLTNAITVAGAGLAPGLTGKLDVVGGKLYLEVSPLYPAFDAGNGFFGGENLIFTNLSGATYYVWSSPDPTVPVSNWTLEGPMTEVVLGSSGTSRYGINLNPATSPVYYIFGNTNTAPYTALAPLVWLTTDDFVLFTVINTNMPISSNGVFQFPFPPTITQPPAGLSVLNGQNASFTVVASGPNLAYQWQFNSLNLPGANSAVLGLTAVTPSQGGDYAVVVTNSLGGVTSSVATLMVSLPPTVTVDGSAPGLIQLNGSSVTDLTYVVQSATNLVSPAWMPVWTNNTGVGGTINFQTSTTNGINQFYRLLFP